MEKIKVLYLSLKPDFSRGGQRSLFHMLSRLDRSRIDAAVVSPAKGELVDAVQELGMRTFVQPWAHFRQMNPVSITKTMIGLRRIFSEFQPDIIHCDAPRNTHLAALVKPKNSKLICHLRVNTFDGFSDRLLAAECNALIAVSKGGMQRFAGFPNKVQNKIHLIYNAVDIEKFKPISASSKNDVRVQFNLPQDRPIVAFLAGYMPVKGHLFFFKIWKRVSEKFPDALLVIAGNGPKIEEDKIRNRVVELGIEDSIRFLPFLDTPEEFLPCCDCLVLPSYDEGFPRIVIEASACGLAVVGSDIPGTNEAILPGKTGFLFSHENSDGWVEGLVKLLENPVMRKKMGDAARKFISENYTLEIQAKKVNALYEQLRTE
ncbi:glycosyltransferase family 4 protein [bacterium]|nr:glycosyltransferase family 4 protein [bacterium]